MKLYGRITAFNVQKVLWLLEELNLEYEHIEVGGKFGGLDSEEFKRVNPLKKIPVLIDGGKTIWESHSVLRYLIATYGQGAFYFDDPYERSLYERWADWAHTSFQPAFMDTFWNYYRVPEADRNMEAVNEAIEKCKECLNVLNAQLEGKRFLVGDSLTIADICAGTALYRLTTQGLNISLPENVHQWYETLQKRKGYQKWVMSDYSELKGRVVC